MSTERVRLEALRVLNSRARRDLQRWATLRLRAGDRIDAKGLASLIAQHGEAPAVADLVVSVLLHRSEAALRAQGKAPPEGPGLVDPVAVAIVGRIGA